MSIWDSVKKFAQPYSDDEYDDYDDYDDYEDEVEEEPVRQAPRRASRPSRPARRAPMQREPEPEIEEDDYEEDFAAAFNSVPKTPAAAPAAPAAAPAVSAERKFPGKVVSMNRGQAQEIVRFHPNSFQDSKKAATDLVAGKAVIVNLEELDKEAARRMVDFLSGVVFAMGGEVEKIVKGAYVFCPPNMFITGGPEALESVVEETV